MCVFFYLVLCGKTMTFHFARVRRKWRIVLLGGPDTGILMLITLFFSANLSAAAAKTGHSDGDHRDADNVSSSMSFESRQPPKWTKLSNFAHDEFHRCRHFLPNSFKETSTIAGNDSAEKLLFIQGLFELADSGREFLGRSELTAACLAIKHINARQFIPGYQLDMYINNTKGDSGVAVDAFFHALYRKPQALMLLGSGVSQVTEQLAQIVSFWNLVQVSFGSMAPTLSDRQSFPLFYRTVAPDSSHNEARVAFVRRFTWDAVAILSQNDDTFTLGINDLVQHLENVNVSVTSTVIFSRQDYAERLLQLKVTDCRIIFASFMERLASDVLCQIFRLEMYGGDYVWIFPENLSKGWWNFRPHGERRSSDASSCTEAQLLSVVDGALFVRSNNAIVGEQPSISGLTNEAFLSEMKAVNANYTDFAPQTYDAVWAMAITLREAEENWKSDGNVTRLEHFHYRRKDMRDTFFKRMADLSFQGLSGPVSFKGADRVGISSFYQNADGELKPVALYYPRDNVLDFNCSFCVSIRWKGGHIPVARRTLKIYIKTIEWTAFVAVAVMASVGILLALAFLVFNLYYRKLKYIKLSSPKLNNMAVVGCVLVYSAVILLGVDHRLIDTECYFPVLCMSRAVLLSFGFSLAFGAMFTKTYRVHQIFIRASSGVVKSKLLRDKRLIFLVGALLLIDCFVVTVWTLVDPMQRQLRNLSIEINQMERDIIYQPQVEECHSVHIERWLGGLYIYKFFLLAVGVYMAWETRNVKIPALNDSQYIGMNVYNVVITSLIVVVMANLISERKTFAFVVVATLIFASTTTTLCLLFVPKLHAIYNRCAGDPIVESMGLRIESNTRRFVIDEKRELYYRAEVQNRVYKRELTELTQEVERLERLLRGETAATNKGTAEKGQGLEALCASTLNHFLYDRVHLRRRSCGPAHVDRIVSREDKYASAIQSHIDYHRRQRKKRLKEYLPEIVISSTSEEHAAEDCVQFQPLLSSWRPADTSNVNDPTHRPDMSRMLPWNHSKRMSFSAGLRPPMIGRNGGKVNQRPPGRRKRSLFIGFLSKAGSEGVLASSSTTASSLDEISLAVASAISRPASQSLLMLDFVAPLVKLSLEDCTETAGIGKTTAASDANIDDEISEDGKSDARDSNDGDNASCLCSLTAGVSRSSFLESCEEIDDSEDEGRLSPPSRRQSTVAASLCSKSASPKNFFLEEADHAGVDIVKFEAKGFSESMSDMVDAKRKEIEGLRTQLQKLEVELKSLEEGSTSAFV